MLAELSSNPLLQSTFIPFVIALVLATVLGIFGRGSGLAIAIGFYVAAWYISGFQILPLTSTRKILILGIAAVLLGIAIDNWRPLRRVGLPIIVVAGVSSALWLIWPLLARSSGSAMWLLAASAVIYVTWNSLWLYGLRKKPWRISSAALLLAVGTGIAALFGASALLGQLASALAAAIAGLLIIGLVFSSSAVNKVGNVGATMALPVAMLSSLIGLSASVYAQLPWYSLAFLATIPLLAYVPLSARNPWRQVLTMKLIFAPAVAAAIFIAWTSGGGDFPF